MVGCGRYHTVGDSLNHNFQDTILMLGTIVYVVKIVKEEHEVHDILP
jgi:hypothetical protein